VRSTLLVLLLLVVPAAFAQSEGSARQVLDQCVAELDDDVLGLEQMETNCPGIRLALEQLGITDLVSDRELGVLTFEGLQGMQALVERYEKEPERAAIDVDTLAPVIESLRKPPVAEQSLSWFERFKRWLREIFQRQQGKSGEDESWLSRWLDEHPMSEVVRWGLVFGAIAIVVLLALGIVINEVRTAARGRRRKAAAEVASAVDVRNADGGAALDVEGDRPSALLRMLIATLVKTGRLNGAHSLTHSELSKRARFDDSGQRDSFQKVAQLAEREVFSGQDVARNDLSEALDIGRTLDAQLKGAAT
jgi:hypothetical protein